MWKKKRKSVAAGEDISEHEEEKPRRETDGMIPAGLPDKFFDDEGEVNLSKVTGKEAIKYMASLGIKIPVMGGVSKA